MSYKIYKHTVSDGRVYIGLTGQKPEYRWNNGKGYKDFPAFFDVILSEGWDNITHEILEEVESLEEARQKEAEYIRQYRSNLAKYGFNTMTPEYRERKTKVYVCEETGEYFYNLKDAGKAHNVCISGISRAANRGGSAGQYHWHIEYI